MLFIFLFSFLIFLPLHYGLIQFNFLKNVMKLKSTTSSEIDPNFEAHLPSLLKVGSIERPSPDLASDLRKRYKTIVEVKRKAVTELKTTNVELSIELEELADELQETQEKFVQAALTWDAWSRPSPDLPKELRAKFDLENTKEDPNYEANLARFLRVGSDENRPEPELPSELRLLKYKNSASVKRLAAKELRVSGNSELAAELEDIATEIEESHERFVEMASKLNTTRYSRNK